MAQGKTDNKVRKVPLCARVSEEMKACLEKEGGLRDHTLSEAVGHALELGTPLYLEQFPKVFEQVVNSET